MNSSTFHFAHPWVLLVLLLLPLIVWRQLRMRRASVRFSDVRLFDTIQRRRFPWIRLLTLCFHLTGWLLLVLALAGPRWPDQGTRLPTRGRSIGIVLDVSVTMDREDYLWDGKTVSRLQAVKDVFRLFVDGGTSPDNLKFAGRKNDLISLIAFADRPEVACPVTLNHGVLLQILDGLEAHSELGEKTNIGDGIALGIQTLQASNTETKILVLLTDGEHNVNDKSLKPRQAAQLAGNLKIPIYVIDAGGLSDGEEPEKRKQIQEILQQVSKISGGEYFTASDSQSLADVCEKIDRKQTSPIETFRYRRYHEGFVWFALASFVCLLTITILEMTLWRQVP